MLALTRCQIRHFAPGDAESLTLHANNRKVWRNLRDLFPHPYSISDAEAFIAGAMGDPRPTSFAIDVGGVAVGGMGLRLKGDVERIGAEIGYWLGEAFWNRGILSEAVPAFTNWAMAEFNLERVEALVFHWNPASARVLKKSGYILEGTMKRSVVKDGEIIDRWIYAFLRRCTPHAVAISTLTASLAPSG